MDDEFWNSGRTPLHDAVVASDYQLVASLIQSGAVIDAHDELDNTPLHLASCSGNYEIASLLEENMTMPGIDSENFDFMTPFQYACERGHINIAKILLEKGAKINKDAELADESDPAIHLAVANGHFDVVSFLIENNADLSCKDSWGDTLLHLASEQGYCEIASLVIEKGAIVDSKNENGETPLYEASKEGHINVAALLLEKGANIHSINGYGYDSLQVACRSGHKEVAALLLDKGANIHSTNNYGDDSLKYACMYGHKEVAALLLEKGANIYYKYSIIQVLKKESKGNSLLHLVTRSTDLAALLLEKGLDIHCRNHDGRTPLHSACERGQNKVAAFLIKKGSDIDCMDQQLMTPLHLACENRRINVVTMLISKGANINYRNDRGETPLHSATDGGHINIITLLLQKGAYIHAKDYKGNTPLHSAFHYKKIISLLLENGADVNSTNEEGFTAFEEYNRRIKGDAEDNDRRRRYIHPCLSFTEQYTMMMRSVNMFVSPNLLKNIAKKKKLGKSCCEELDRLKVTKIGNSNVTFYKFLTKGVQQLVRTLQSDTIFECLTSGAYKAEFPNYGVLISNHFQRGIYRKTHIEKVLPYFHKTFYVLPEECVDLILEYFSNDELNLINF